MLKRRILICFWMAFIAGCRLATPLPEAETHEIPAPIAEQPEIPSRLQPLTFDLLGTPAAYRELGFHSALWDMQLWHDRIYLAHGDWYANSGPLRMLYYDVRTEKFVHEDAFLLEEHGMEVFRVYGDKLYLPGTEAIENLDNGYIHEKSWDAPWSRSSPIPGAVHLWDIVSLNGMLVAVGQTRQGSALWLSADGGWTWEERGDFRSEGYATLNSGFVLGEKIFVTTSGTGCLAFDEGSWQPAKCLESDIYKGVSAVQKHAAFQGTIAMAPHWATVDHRLHFFDGQVSWVVEFPEPVRDVIHAGGSLFVLAGGSSGRGAIFTARSLDCRCGDDFSREVNFDFFDASVSPEEDEFMRLTVGSTPHSLEFAAGRFYIGLADGRLFRSEVYRPEE